MTLHTQSDWNEVERRAREFEGRAGVTKQFKIGKEAQRRFAARHAIEQAQGTENLKRRLLDLYKVEPDREYAETMWGDSLRRMGVDLT